VGVLAAAGLHALDHHVERLKDDHENARELAAGLARIPAFAPNTPETNIVVVDVRGSVPQWLAALADVGVLAVPFGPARFRMVTHLDVTTSDIAVALTRIAHVAESLAA
jgi:threonine aldolase